MIDNNDSYISEEEEDLCPLCVEEMDLSDKNFKPCPCGYQICQFCYNNIISNPDLNHNCPACRRVYSKDTVEYKVLSPDELNVLKLKQLEKQRKRKQREKELRDAEQASKKQLAGMRVIQKNLVYVVGLNLPGSTEDLQTLFRSDAYFGQYGKISKVVVNRKAPNPANPHSAPGLSVYVTFVRKEDALKCIQAVDGSISDGRLLKAAHGTTKYCSSYLRGQQCPNPNCMFLHEPGEEAESYNRENMSNRRIHSEVRSAIHGLAPALNGTPTLQDATLDTSASQNNLYLFNGNNPNSNIGNNLSQYYYKPTTTTINTGNNNSEEEEEAATDENGPLLPSTANWGKGSSANLYNMNYQHSSTPIDTTNLATAFPTLGESVQLQQHIDRDIKRKDKKKDVEILDCIDTAKDAKAIFRGIVEGLSTFDPSFVRFDDHKIDQTEFSGYPKLFNFAPGTLSLPDGNTREISNKIVDNLLISKTNNHIMGVQNIQFILQLHQQQQRSQQQQPQPSKQPSQDVSSLSAQQQYIAQQQRLQRLQQQQQQQSSASLTPAANLAMLQQQHQGNSTSSYQQHQQQQMMAAAAAAQQMKLNPSNGNSTPTPAAPAPPGLFSGVSLNNVAGNDHAESASNNAARSELLNHLLAGKK